MISAGTDLSVTGKNVTIASADNTDQSTTENKSSFTGLTIGLSSPGLNVAQSAISSAQGASSAIDPRLAALLGVEALKSEATASQAIKGGDLQKNVTVGVSFGSNSQQSSSTTNTSTAVGSALSAGGNLNITATTGN